MVYEAGGVDGSEAGGNTDGEAPGKGGEQDVTVRASEVTPG